MDVFAKKCGEDAVGTIDEEGLCTGGFSTKPAMEEHKNSKLLLLNLSATWHSLSGEKRKIRKNTKRKGMYTENGIAYKKKKA